MEEHNLPEAVAKRATQEDPIVMYLIVREALNMSIGKTAAQCAHASQMLQMKYGGIHEELINRRKHDLVRPSPEEKTVQWELSFEQWIASSFRKVVLTANEKEWVKLKEECKETPNVIVVDAGLTELIPGTETVVGLWPMHKSERPLLLKKLQTLK